LRKTSQAKPQISKAELTQPIETVRLVKLVNYVSVDVIRVEIGKVIATILGDLGVKTLPDKYAQQRIIYYLMRYYRDFSVTEVREAFELALTGEFDVNIEHYNSFDIRYISRILNAYRSFRRKRNLQESKRTKNKLEPKKFTKEELEQSRIQYFKGLVVTYENFRKGDEINIIHSMAYNYLIDFDVLQVSQSYWLEAMEQAERLYREKLLRSRSLEHKQILKNFESIKYQYPFEITRIQRIAKKRIVLNFFQNLKKQGKSLNEIFIKSGIYEN